ncbi:MAG: hypothetical protein SFX18_09655 [Pirellulales bacterium]|nr:hypothetical protein [Pirellulales bacterium]
MLRRFLRLFLLVAMGLMHFPGSGTARAGEIGWLESFSLGPDRAAALKQLIPGTEDYFYYHCLHYQSQELFDKVDELLAAWVKQHNWTPRAIEIQNRQALLNYKKNPQAALDLIRQRLNLQFNHQRELLNQKPQLPTALDPKSISRDTLRALALQQFSNTLEGFEDSALEWLATDELNPDQRRQLLARLSRPDYPDLAKMVVDDLNHRDSGGFGQFAIHDQLLLSQLEEVLKLKPDLRNNGRFVNAMLVRLAPDNDTNWRQNRAELRAYLNRLREYAATLDSVHNSLKAHVLYHLLLLDQKEGKFDRALFVEYLQLPKNAVYIEPKYLEPLERRERQANLQADYTPLTQLPVVGNDEPLVRSLFLAYFVEAEDFAEFKPLVREDYLRQLFAEAKIVNGVGDAERWYALLPPEQARQLRERIDLDFAPTNQTEFAVDEPVALDLYVKNVGTLIVKVFEINTDSYYRQQLSEIGTDINLDGLVANSEQTLTYADPAVRRVKRHFEFPQLKQRGVYVIDFIGNGRASRALIRKGKLQFISRQSVAGQIFTILDEQNQIVPNATIWHGGTLYTANDKQEIVLPFSNQTGRQPLILSANGFSTLEYFEHAAEAYSLNAGFYVDREELLSRREAQLLVRPRLSLNGTPVTGKVLEEPILTIVSTDLDNVVSTKVITDLKFLDDREITVPFLVPQRLASVRFVLQAKAQVHSQNQKTNFAAEQTFAINEIDRTEKTEALHFIKSEKNYFLELLGKTGENKADRAVQISLKLHDFKQPVNLTLQTDAGGRISLGPLPGVQYVTATGPQGQTQGWPLLVDGHSYPANLHGGTTAPLQLPYPAPGEELDRGDLTLLELRGDRYVVDRFEHLSRQPGLLIISKLPPGDYRLWIRSQKATMDVRITAGKQQQHYVLGNSRKLQVINPQPLSLPPIAVEGEKIKITLVNNSPVARVHVLANRYQPRFLAYEYLFARSREPGLIFTPRVQSQYIEGRDIGDEFRYIIERRFSQKFPGNMLERPSLLLNPWAVRSTETAQQEALDGTQFGGVAGDAAAMAKAMEVQQAGGSAMAGNADFANLNFLANTSLVLVNLEANEQGVIEIDRKDLGNHQDIFILAIDPQNTAVRRITLPAKKAQFLDLRLAKTLDPAKHFMRQQRINILQANEQFGIEDVTSSRFELYDTLPKVQLLYGALNGDPKFAEFSFLRNWPNLKDEEKRDFYHKYACHELHLFIYRKDPDFFKNVLLPYLGNKKEKQLLDRWLLSADLAEDLQPWEFERSNTLERLLVANRVKAASGPIKRLVRDQFSLLAIDRNRQSLLFETAIKGSALETGDSLGIRKAILQEEAKADKFLERAADMPAGATYAFNAPGAPAPPAPLAAAIAAAEPKLESAEKLREESSGKKQAEMQRRGAFRTKDGKGDSDGVNFFADDRALGKSVEQYYRKLDKTMEWAESNYYRLTIDQQTAGLISVNPFWNSVAEADLNQPFQSTQLAEATRNLHEMLTALALLDIPHTAGKHEVKFDGPKMSLTAASPIVVYHEQILPADKVAERAPILVSENFFRHGERFRQENGETFDKFISEEFLVDVVYGCSIVVTNPTSSRKKVSVLMQIPAGSLPVLGGQATKSVPLDLEPYHTQTLEYFFYFPVAGKFAHYPVQVASAQAAAPAPAEAPRGEKDEGEKEAAEKAPAAAVNEVLAFAQPFTFNVVRELTNVDQQSWDYISQHGSNDDVLAFLKRENVLRVNLDRIAWRVQDKEFFNSVLALLSARHIYHHTLWSYGVLHNDPASIRQFLQFAGDFVAQTGDWLDSPLLTIDPVTRRAFEQLDYMPLVNARVGQLGRTRQILNDRFFTQYNKLLKILSYRRTLNDTERMVVIYYLLLQDRVAESLDFFEKVNPEQLPTRLQYDYFAAYLSFSQSDPDTARKIAAKYAEYPVNRWRTAFQNVINQADEIAQPAVAIADEQNRTQVQTAQAARTPSLDFKIDNRTVRLNLQNVPRLRVNYYLMDLELLFSRNPFVQGESRQFSFIQPNLTETIEVPEGATSHEFAVPEKLATSNILVEISGAGVSRQQAYYSNSLRATVVENFGQVRVTRADADKPLPKVYVKVYARMKDGNVRFYKDGYTDLRGRFDYTSLSTNELDFVDKFSLLIMSEDFGAVVREASPPQR